MAHNALHEFLEIELWDDKNGHLGSSLSVTCY